MPQLVDLWSLASDDALGHLESGAECILPADGVLGTLALDFNHRDSRIVRTAVVLPIAEVAEPRLETGRVELVHLFPVGDDGRIARDGRPFAVRVQEAQVDFRVGLDIVRLARLGVGVEDEVRSVVLLSQQTTVSGVCEMSTRRENDPVPLRRVPWPCSPACRRSYWW